LGTCGATQMRPMSSECVRRWSQYHQPKSHHPEQHVESKRRLWRSEKRSIPKDIGKESTDVERNGDSPTKRQRQGARRIGGSRKKCRRRG